MCASYLHLIYIQILTKVTISTILQAMVEILTFNFFKQINELLKIS